MTADMAAETTADTRAGRSSLSTTNPDLPTGPLTHRQIITILIGLMMGMFLAALDQTIVASAMRTIADDLQGLAAQAWVTTAYLITSTIVTPLYGKLSDIYGRKPFFIFAISIFTVGSMLCTLATSIGTLAMFRAVQGLGAGGLMALALAIIGDIVPPRERAKYQGYFLAVFGTSSVLGPVIGGFFAGQDDHPRHHRLALGLPRQRADRHRGPHRRHADPAPAPRRGATTASTTGARSPSPSAWSRCSSSRSRAASGAGARSSALLCYGIGVLGLVAFFVIERAMGEEALVPLRLFQIRTVGVSSIVSVFIGMGMFGGIAALPLYLQIVKGASPTEAGLQLLPLTLGIMFGSILSGQLISRTGRYRQYPDHRRLPARRVVLRLALHAGRHPALEDADRRGLLRRRARLQLPAADPRRAERGQPARHRRGHLLGDVHPPDRRHARHGRVPVDPLLPGGRRTSPRRTPAAARTRTSLPRCRTRRATPRPTRSFIEGMKQAAAATGPRSTTRSRTRPSSSASTRGWPSRTSTASRRPCRRCSSWRRSSCSSRSSSRSSCRTWSCGRARPTTNEAATKPRRRPPPGATLRLMLRPMPPSLRPRPRSWARADNGSEPNADRKRGRHRAQPGEKLH